jgi:hypothetical protein
MRQRQAVRMRNAARPVVYLQSHTLARSRSGPWGLGEPDAWLLDAWAVQRPVGSPGRRVAMAVN